MLGHARRREPPPAIWGNYSLTCGGTTTSLLGGVYGLIGVGFEGLCFLWFWAGSRLVPPFLFCSGVCVCFQAHGVLRFFGSYMVLVLVSPELAEFPCHALTVFVYWFGILALDM